MIRLNCFFRAKEGKYEEALVVAKSLVKESLTQEGCIAYDVFESATRKDIFIICETWASEEVLNEHSKSKPFTKYVGIMETCGELKLEKFNF